MKPWRVFLLLLLLVLLPLRGALGAALMCPPGNHAPAAALEMHGDEHAHHHHADPEPAAPADASHGSGSCHVCAGSCSATPLLAAMPVIRGPGDAQRVGYPDWAAPAPLFLSDGQERPPRST